MYSKEVTVMNASGLHARPASNLVQFCAKYPCKLTMTGGRSPVDLKSIFAVQGRYNGNRHGRWCR